MSDSIVTWPAQAVDASPKRRQVIDAATELFLAQGYGAVSMDAVARAAGVSKATLYAHFASKEALFATIMRDRCSNNQLDETLFPEQVTDLRATLEAMGRRITRFMLQERTLAIYRIALAEATRFPELGRTFFDNGPGKFCKRGPAWLALQQAAGLVRAADLEVAANQFTALLRSDLFLRASLALEPSPSEAEIDATVAAAVDTWLRAFGARPEEPGFTAPGDCA